MSKFEDVKRLLSRNSHFHIEEFGNSGKVEILDFDAETAAHQICMLWEQPKSSDSLAQPSPLKVYPTCAGDGSDPPFGAVEQPDEDELGEPVPGAIERIAEAVTPQPEDGRLISHEQMCAEIWDLGAGLEAAEGRLPSQQERFCRIARAQLAKDMEHEQAMLKQVLEDIEDYWAWEVAYSTGVMAIRIADWQALKQEYLGEKAK